MTRRHALLVPAVLALVCACQGQPQGADNEAGARPPAAADAHAMPHDDAAPAADMAATEPAASGFYAFSTASLEGQPVDLSAYAGKVALVVNVASKCGYTRQYSGLQQLWQDYRERGLVVMGFPSNEFGGQEPGSPAQIAQFCSAEYGVDFPMFAKCEVKTGPGQSPIYGFLGTQTGQLPQWNFTKYLVARDGTVLAVFPSKVEPSAAELKAAIEAALG